MESISKTLASGPGLMKARHDTRHRSTDAPPALQHTDHLRPGMPGPGPVPSISPKAPVAQRTGAALTASPRSSIAYSALSLARDLKEVIHRIAARIGKKNPGNSKSATEGSTVKTILCLLLLLTTSGSNLILHAQQTPSPSATLTTTTAVPRLVSYSGKLTDDQRKVSSSVVGVSFSIYKDQEGGAPLWMETQNVTPDSTGHYSVRLGTTLPDGLPLDLFSTGDARWLGVRVNGGTEQARVLLLSVPYALKAADSETLGGFPASAFMLATPPAASTISGSTTSGSSTPAISAADPAIAPPATVTGSGTLNFLPLWTGTTTIGNSALFQSGSGTTAKVGINTSAPASALDVKGTTTLHGPLSLPATGTATASGAKSSQPQNLVASVFNSSTSTPVAQTFRWQAEGVNNNTSNANGTLNLLYGKGTASPTETGLKLSSNGQITFASGQTFPGTGTVTSVGLSAPSSDFTVSGSPVTGSGTLALKWTAAPTSSNVVNSIVKRDGVGNFSANGVTVSTLTASNLGGAIVATSSSSDAFTSAISGSSTVTSDTVNTYGVAGGSSSGLGAGVFGVNNNAFSGNGVYGEANNNSGAVEGDNFNPGGGAGVIGSGAWGFYTENNVHQGLSSGGWVKGLIAYSGFSGGRIIECYNFNIPGSAATVPPCGFSVTRLDVGDYLVDLGFEVDNRFLSVTPSQTSSPFTACTNDAAACLHTLTANQAEVSFFNGTFQEAKFFLVVY
jgi:hypothetical protein